jgi:outer membrane protein assembly factor BamB
MSLNSLMLASSVREKYARPSRRAQLPKVDLTQTRVNLPCTWPHIRFAALLLLTAACHPPRPAPPVPPGEWTAALGGPARAAYAGETVAVDLHAQWRKGVDRGFAAALQVHGPILVATTTGRAVVALNARTGMQYWSRRFNGPIAGTALRQDDLLFLATGDRENRVHAINITRGRGVWSRRVGPVRVEPLLLDSALIVVTETGDVVALRARDGSPLWRTAVGAAPATSPVSADGVLLVATTRDSLVRLDAGGRITGRIALPATPSAAALVRGDTLMLPAHSGDIIAVLVRDSLRLLWHTRLGAPVLAPVVPGRAGVSYALDRDAAVYRIQPDGSATRIAALGGAASGCFAAVGDHLVVGRLDGTLFLLDAEGRVVFTLDMGDSLIAPVAAQGGALFVPLLRGAVVKLES